MVKLNAIFSLVLSEKNLVSERSSLQISRAARLNGLTVVVHSAVAR